MKTNRATSTILGPSDGRSRPRARAGPAHERDSCARSPRAAHAKAAYDDGRGYEDCSCCVLSALQTQMRRRDEGALRASTALAGDTARMGETCGAFLGGIMSAGQIHGSENPSDFDSHPVAMGVETEIFRCFEREYGTTRRRDIQQKRLGSSFDFFKGEDRKAWYQPGGFEVCASVCVEAARITADVLLPADPAVAISAKPNV